MFAAVQFGPLAAARDVGIGLAIALALMAWLGRSRRLWLAAGLVAGMGVIPTILAAGAPFSRRSEICLGCGMKRQTHEVCGWTVKNVTAQTEFSRWAAPIVPTGHAHSWASSSTYYRPRWFEPAWIACGGPSDGVVLAWHLAHYGDPAAGERALREYHDILAGKSTKSMAVHRQEVQDAVNAAMPVRADPYVAD
jgi:hypothetical protein